MISFKITEEEIKKLLKKYNFIKKKLKNFIFFYKKINNITISIYKTKTILLQGNKEEINKFLIIEKIKKKDILITQNKEFNIKNTLDYVGGDESGVGDYFGPIVLTLFKITKKIKELKIFEKIKDSKLLKKKEILKFGNILIKFKNNFKVFIISNTELNNNHKKNINSHETLLMNYIKLSKNIIFKNKKIIIDAFLNKKKMEKYCIKNNIENPKFILLTKAESKSLSVSAASIISRFYFLKEIEKIEKKLNIKINLGANSNVKKQVKIFKKKNLNFKKYIKLYFKI